MKSFSELNLIEPLQRALVDEKYTIPTEVQAQTIPHALAGRDVLGTAQTGTGKTAAFALPILNRLGSQQRKPIRNAPRALVLAPTRELAVQIADSFGTYGRHVRVKHSLAFGGVSQVSQVRNLERGSDVLVATPGRLLDLMNQGHVRLDELEVFVLDEADRMLDMGFLPDLKRIIAALPKQRQSLFFSATISPKVAQLAQQLLNKPARIDVVPKSSSVTLIEQRVIFVEPHGKKALLEKLLRDDAGQTLVFTKTKRGANRVAEQLAREGFKATAIHGNKSQAARQRALEEFRRGHVQVLVATDVAARGIDVDGISLVVNFEMPREAESYVHRIGRTGRAGASGIALSFCSGEERGLLRDIERLIGQKVRVDVNHGTSGGSERVTAARPARKRPDRKRPAGSGAASGGRPPRTAAATGGGKGRKSRPGKNARAKKAMSASSH
ncbi:MAG: DEAD/DEAH box helicase [Pirellulales bacterium]